ncbi:hypothetical protein AAZV13_08G147100 [Glycine max]
MGTIVEADNTYTKILGRWPVFYYGMGHMLNDITAACWFTYLLLFLTDIGLSPRNAAVVMLSGQVADGFVTIFVGELIDRFGHFKIWHGAGSLLVAISFSSVFGGCLPCKLFSSNSGTFETLSYSMYAAIFNVGWAATQVSHMISWDYWFKRILYYQVALVYVLTRLVLNVSQAYLAFFVINDLQMAQSAKALVPALIYICSFVVSIALQEIAWTGRMLKAYYSAGCILWIFCGAVILLLTTNMSYVMYIVSVFIGIANALMMVTGVSMQNFLIGENLNGCAFVVGSLSFLDKISCGLALYVLQSNQNLSPQLQATTQFPFSVTRIGLGLVPAFCALVGVVVTCTMDFHNPSKSLTAPLLA